MVEQGYRVPEVTKIVGITYRQLDYWARTGLVRPSVKDAQGSGSQRLYSFQDLAMLKLIKRMLDSGVNLQQIRRAMATLKELKEPALGTTLVSDGNRIYQVESPEAVVDLLYESEVTHEAGSFEREREVHQHIGDFTLFMAGLFPEYLKRIKTAGLIYHKDFLVDYIKTGKRSYRMAAEFGLEPRSTEERPSPPLFRKLSENFELCVVGLGFIRGDLDRMQDEGYRKARRLLLN